MVDDFEEIMNAAKSGLRSEMQTHLERNPSADRRKLLDRAVQDQMDKLELRVIAVSEDPDHLRQVAKGILEEAANEIRSIF